MCNNITNYFRVLLIVINGLSIEKTELFKSNSVVPKIGTFEQTNSSDLGKYKYRYVT